MQPSPVCRRASVHDDWVSWLRGDKDISFRRFNNDLESSYTMFSVALDEALELLRSKHGTKACQALGVTPDLCARLCISLMAALQQMGEHARHYGVVPNVAPLDPSNFRGARGQRTARLNSLLSRVLLTQRSQFLYKLSVLEDMVEDLRSEFVNAADELATGSALHPHVLWKTLEDSHFDINTCLRESIVLLKSFFVVVPEDQVQILENSIRALRHRSLSNATRRHIRRIDSSVAGRGAQVAGK